MQQVPSTGNGHTQLILIPGTGVRRTGICSVMSTKQATGVVHNTIQIVQCVGASTAGRRLQMSVDVWADV